MLKPALVVIPARMASVRLPGKPLADIHGEAMIVRVWRRAKEADIGPVIVAAAEQQIVDAVTAAGGQAVLTDPNHRSGSDRAWEAVENYDPRGDYGKIINLQGDLPTIEAEQIRLALDLLEAKMSHPRGVQGRFPAAELCGEDMSGLRVRHDHNNRRFGDPISVYASFGPAPSRNTLPSYV